MWTIFHVRWEFITQLCASVPGRSELIKGWLDSRSPTVRAPSSKSLDEIHAEVLETLATPDEEREPTTLVFQRVKGQLVVRYATIRAHLKDCAYQLQTYTAGYVQGDRSLRTKVANGVYWPFDRPPVVLFHGTPYIPILGLDGAPLKQPNGMRITSEGEEDGQGPREKAIHVMTPMGQRSALKAFEFCEQAVLEFRLAVLTAQDRVVKRGKEIMSIPGREVINEEDLRTLMLYGGMHGYGGERSEDGGRYIFTITKERSEP